MFENVTFINLVVFLLLTVVLVWSAITDIRSREIKNYIMYPALILIIAIRLFHHPQGLLSYLLALVPVILVFLVSFFSNTKAIGGGDVKIILFLALTLGGFGTIISIFYTCILVLLFHFIALLVANKKYDVLPLAPFLLLGVIAYLSHPYWLVPLIS